MDYEKAYKEARERAKQSLSYPDMPGFMRVDQIFPELAESEDERIRNDIMEAVENWYPYERVEEIRAYLEKQKKQKSIEDVVKDITKNKETATKFLKSAGIMDDNGELAEMYRSEQKPTEWREEDIDKMVNERARKSGTTKTEMCFYRQGIEDTLKSLRPQPKVELTLLDENIINAAVAFVEQNDHFNCWGGIDKHTVIKALRSLKPHWKPSEEQINALEDCVNKVRDIYNVCNVYTRKYDAYPTLKSLLHDLKSL